MKHKWTPLTTSCPIPPDAVLGGYDCDRSPIYVGRAYHEDTELLAKVIPSKRSATVCWEGCEIAKTDYEILTGENYRWFECFVGTMPQTAIQMGNNANGEPLYIGRGHLNGSVIVGGFDPGNRHLYIPFDGEERCVDCCEILTYQTPHRWVSGSVKDIPKDAVIGGHESRGSIIYVGRAYHDGEVLPAKISPQTGGAYVSLAGEDVFTTEFEFLVGDGYRWVGGKLYPDLPLGAVSTGRTRSGDRVYVGRGFHNGSLMPGKTYSTEYCVYVPFGGKEIKLKEYEVLVRNR